MKKTFYTTAVTLLVATGLIFTSCSKDDDDSTPTPTEKVTFDKHISPIVSAKCGPCHVGSGAGQTKYFEYATAKAGIENIISRINLDEGTTGFMPNGGTKLTQEQLDLFAQWKTDGLLEKE